MRILMFAPSWTLPSARFRLLQFVPPLRQLGHDVTVRVLWPDRFWHSSARHPAIRHIHERAATIARLSHLPAILWDARRFDVIIMNRDLMPETGFRMAEPILNRLNPHLVFDIDDGIHLGYRAEKLAAILPFFACVVAGNAELVKDFSRYHPNVRLLPTVVDTDRIMPCHARTPGPVRIGWTGSRVPMKQYLPIVREAIECLAQHMDMEFLVISNEDPHLEWPGVKIRYLPWRETTEAADLQLIDIGLMPLAEGAFERYKCGAKALLYMAAGIPALVSPVGVNSEIVAPGLTGFHCRSRESWLEALLVLSKDGQMRNRFGMAGRDRVERLYSIRSVMPELLAVLESVRSGSMRVSSRKLPLCSDDLRTERE